ncbi:hypothetical protein PF008_g8259 [Phytophthora fragariae]|uniref:Uncharacterized protein n=1 Tax=Phytophthora fragariae TaxID=53985 RepID=A0A6G0S095_9STRA|nr:hypothetical protein PF008_g8259 [Phytophthora fragariae]
MASALLSPTAGACCAIHSSAHFRPVTQLDIPMLPVGLLAPDPLLLCLPPPRLPPCGCPAVVHRWALELSLMTLQR